MKPDKYQLNVIHYYDHILELIESLYDEILNYFLEHSDANNIHYIDCCYDTIYALMYSFDGSVSEFVDYPIIAFRVKNNSLQIQINREIGDEWYDVKDTAYVVYIPTLLRIGDYIKYIN